jgi:hypothetical protein
VLFPLGIAAVCGVCLGGGDGSGDWGPMAAGAGDAFLLKWRGPGTSRTVVARALGLCGAAVGNRWPPVGVTLLASSPVEGTPDDPCAPEGPGSPDEVGPPGGPLPLASPASRPAASSSSAPDNGDDCYLLWD